MFRILYIYRFALLCEGQELEPIRLLVVIVATFVATFLSMCMYPVLQLS